MDKSFVDRESLFTSIMPKDVGNETVIIDFLRDGGFFIAPASTKYHGNNEGGLFDHSLQTTIKLVDLSLRNRLTWIRPESPYIVGMFHDL